MRVGPPPRHPAVPLTPARTNHPHVVTAAQTVVRPYPRHPRGSLAESLTLIHWNITVKTRGA